MKISICIPTHNMKNGEFFWDRCIRSIQAQTYADVEIVTTSGGSFAQNVNDAIKKAKGDIIHIMCVDDYFFDENSIVKIMGKWPFKWLVSGCINDDGETFSSKHFPLYNDDIYIGNNTIGPPSVLTFVNDDPLLFDENLKWLVDCDYYKRLYDRYGLPTILNEVNIIQGIGDHQATHSIDDSTKLEEYNYMVTKNI